MSPVLSTCQFRRSFDELKTLQVVRIFMWRTSRSCGWSFRIDLTSDPPTIKRVRQKSHVYGEWPVWPETVAVLQAHWATRKDKHNVAVVSSRGDCLTGDNIGNIWCRFKGKYKLTHPNIQQLGFKHFRKTAAQIIRNVSDGEVAGVFLTHGQPVQSDELADVYSNRPFDKVAKATMDARERLLGKVF